MKKLAAREAKTHFGELMDTVQREPVTIEKHGRPVAVILSMEDYKLIETLKLEKLKTRLAIGEAQADQGIFAEQSVKEIIDEAKQEQNAS